MYDGMKYIKLGHRCGKKVIMFMFKVKIISVYLNHLCDWRHTFAVPSFDVWMFGCCVYDKPAQTRANSTFSHFHILQPWNSETCPSATGKTVFDFSSHVCRMCQALKHVM
jgi:hypothetical protein